MKKIVFRGTATALVTPLCQGRIDLKSFERLCALGIESGVDALVIAGTTGECATLSDEERILLFERAQRINEGRVPLIFGTGSNDTRTAVKLTKIAERMGASAALSVTPYYNKGTEDGIIAHYSAIAESTDLPTILYNVPSRTGVDLSLSAIEKLSEAENIVGIKEASDSVDRLTALSALSDKLALYCGNDSQIYACLSLGGLGVISVLSNIIPRTVSELTEAYFSGDTKRALTLQQKLLPLVRVMFAETNPSPIKYALSLKELCDEELRLPLAPPKEITKKKIKEALEKYRDLL